MYKAAGQGQTTPWDRIRMSTETSCQFATSLKKSNWSLILYNFFMILYMYIAPGQGLTNSWGRNFDVNRNILSLRSFVAGLKQISLKSDFIHLFIILYMYNAPGQGQTSPRGQNFDVNRNVLSLHSFVASFKKCLWGLILYHFFFHDLIHVYSPGIGAGSPQGTKFWCQQKGLITLPICCKFQRNFFEVWFYTIF